MPPASMTRPSSEVWHETDAAYRRWERSTVLGTGQTLWQRSTDAVMRWGVKTRSGFEVTPDAVELGATPIITARVFGAPIREPVEVVAVADRSDRVGFAYRTLPGHPVDGEEAFIVHRTGETVLLTIRSLTRPARSGWWRIASPGIRVVQVVARRRYVRALI